MPEREELKSFLMKVKEESESLLKAQHSENEDHGILSHHFMGDRWGNSRKSVRLYFLGSKITADGDCSHEIKRRLLLGRKVMTNLDSFPGGSDGKASAHNAGEPGSVPGLGRFLGEGNGNPLQYSCLENPRDREAW